MPIQVVPYTAEWVPAVLAFNDRLHATGTHWGWYGDPVDSWLPARDRKTWREHWLAVEDGATVRGAYALKPHEWSIRARPVVDGRARHRGPSTAPDTLGLRLLREMLKRIRCSSAGATAALLPMLQIRSLAGRCTALVLLRVLPFRPAQRAAQTHARRLRSTRPSAAPDPRPRAARRARSGTVGRPRRRSHRRLRSVGRRALAALHAALHRDRLP
jgi:hypothetical protein